MQDLARSLFVAGPWRQVAPLRLFGHSMGAVVAFEFARIAESRGAPVQRLWASAAPAPCAVEAKPDLPTSHDDLLVDMTDFGGTDAELLADPEFAELLVTAMRADYAAINRYTCGPDVQIAADISVLGAHGDPRVDAAELQQWEGHTAGAFELDWYDGGHFYLDDHIDARRRAGERRWLTTRSWPPPIPSWWSAWRWRPPAESTPPPDTGNCWPRVVRR